MALLFEFRGVGMESTSFLNPGHAPRSSPPQQQQQQQHDSSAAQAALNPQSHHYSAHHNHHQQLPLAPQQPPQQQLRNWQPTLRFPPQQQVGLPHDANLAPQHDTMAERNGRRGKKRTAGDQSGDEDDEGRTEGPSAATGLLDHNLDLSLDVDLFLENHTGNGFMTNMSSAAPAAAGPSAGLFPAGPNAAAQNRGALGVTAGVPTPSPGSEAANGRSAGPESSATSPSASATASASVDDNGGDGDSTMLDGLADHQPKTIVEQQLLSYVRQLERKLQNAKRPKSQTLSRDTQEEVTNAIEEGVRRLQYCHICHQVLRMRNPTDNQLFICGNGSLCKDKFFSSAQHRERNGAVFGPTIFTALETLTRQSRGDKTQDKWLRSLRTYFEVEAQSKLRAWFDLIIPQLHSPSAAVKTNIARTLQCVAHNHFNVPTRVYQAALPEAQERTAVAVTPRGTVGVTGIKAVLYKKKHVYLRTLDPDLQDRIDTITRPMTAEDGSIDLLLWVDSEEVFWESTQFFRDNLHAIFPEESGLEVEAVVRRHDGLDALKPPKELFFDAIDAGSANLVDFLLRTQNFSSQEIALAVHRCIEADNTLLLPRLCFEQPAAKILQMQAILEMDLVAMSDAAGALKVSNLLEGLGSAARVGMQDEDDDGAQAMDTAEASPNQPCHHGEDWQAAASKLMEQAIAELMDPSKTVQPGVRDAALHPPSCDLCVVADQTMPWYLLPGRPCASIPAFASVLRSCSAEVQQVQQQLQTGLNLSLPVTVRGANYEASTPARAAAQCRAAAMPEASPEDLTKVAEGITERFVQRLEHGPRAGDAFIAPDADIEDPPGSCFDHHLEKVWRSSKDPYNNVLVAVECARLDQGYEGSMVALLKVRLDDDGKYRIHSACWQAKAYAEVVPLSLRPVGDACAVVNACAGQRLTLTVHLRNIGRSTWNQQVKLACCEGLPEVVEVPMPLTSPSSIATVQLSFVVPNASGKVKTVWQLQSRDEDEMPPGDPLIITLDVSL